MTEESFLKKLSSYDDYTNNDNNKNKELLELLRVFLESNGENFGTRILHKAQDILGIKRDKKTPEQSIEENFVKVLNKFDYYYFINSVLPLLITRGKLQDFLEECFPIFLENVKYCIDRKGSSFNESGFKIRSLISMYTKSIQNVAEFEEKNVEIILKTVPTEELLSVVKMLKGKSDKVDAILNSTMEEKKNEIVQYIITKAFKNKRSEYIMQEGFTEQIEKNYAPTVLRMLQELMKSEGKSWIDLQEIGGASFSQVFEIGDKIFKIGIPRRTYDIPYHKRLLKPLVRTNFYAENEKDVVACVEISEKVEMIYEEEKDPERAASISADVLYEIWRELREEGIIWADPHIGNIGILLKDNVPVLNGEKIDVDNEAIGFKSGKHFKEEALKKGDYVIIDTDLLYSAKDEHIEMTATAMMYERHYQAEKHNSLMSRSKRIKSRGLTKEMLNSSEFVEYDRKDTEKYGRRTAEVDTDDETR